ncbi:hypothetical protein KY285_016750 [Solanum tuberosum]|nr:hypothetical protein KY285_016750 [Solanum tuberosum]
MCYKRDVETIPCSTASLSVVGLPKTTVILLAKVLWNFRTRTSLLNQFLEAKYCTGTHPVGNKWRSGQLHMWKRMMKVKKYYDHHILWKIAKGNCSFWRNNWTGNGPLCNLLNHQQSSKDIKVSDCIENEISNMPKLMDIIPSHIAEHNQGIKIHDAHKDVSVWTLEDMGRFTCKSAWRSLRKFKTISLTSMKNWHPKLSFKVQNAWLV